MVSRTQDCEYYFHHIVNAVSEAGPTTKEEEDMPLSYGIMLHKQVSFTIIIAIPFDSRLQKLQIVSKRVSFYTFCP